MFCLLKQTYGPGLMREMGSKDEKMLRRKLNVVMCWEKSDGARNDVLELGG